VREGLAEVDRGKPIMASGTEKTFTSLKNAEDLVGRGGRVLFMVPSPALMSQTKKIANSLLRIPFSATREAEHLKSELLLEKFGKHARIASLSQTPWLAWKKVCPA